MFTAKSNLRMRQPGLHQCGRSQPKAVGLPLALARLQHARDAAGFPIQLLAQQATGAERIQRLAHPAQAVAREPGGRVVVRAGQRGDQGCWYAGAALGWLRLGIEHRHRPAPARHRVGQGRTADACANHRATCGRGHHVALQLPGTAQPPGRRVCKVQRPVTRHKTRRLPAGQSGPRCSCVDGRATDAQAGKGFYGGICLVGLGFVHPPNGIGLKFQPIQQARHATSVHR